MNERYNRTGISTTLPVSLDAAKRHLRVDFESEDVLIRSMIETAKEYVETRTGRTLITTTYALKRDCFPQRGKYLALKFPPLQSIIDVTYFDADNVSQTLAAAKYRLLVDEYCESGLELDAKEEWPATYDREDAVTVNFIAGYGADDVLVPAIAKHAILLLVGHWYENREAVLVGTVSKELELTIDTLLGALGHGWIAGATQ